MKYPLILGGLMALLACNLSHSAPTSNSFTAARTTSTTAAPKKAKKARAPKPPKDKGYGENSSERDKRLLRECRGKPNAGACEGYAN
jgi:hypothetical protein